MSNTIDIPAARTHPPAVIVHLDNRGSYCVIAHNHHASLQPVEGEALIFDVTIAPMIADFLEASGPPASFPFVGPASATLTLQLDNTITWHVDNHLVGRLIPQGATELARIVRALRAVWLTHQELQDPDTNLDALLMLLALAGNNVELAPPQGTAPAHQPVPEPHRAPRQTETITKDCA